MSHNPQLRPRNTLLLLLFLSSCSLLKNKSLQKTDSLSHSVITSSSSSSTNTLANQQHLVLRSDSSSSELMVTIIPEGEFSFSSATGFKGKASSLFIRGTAKSFSALRDSSASGSEMSSDAAASSHAEQQIEVLSKTKTVEKKRNSMSGFWVAGLVLAGAGVWWWRNKWNRKEI